MGALRRPGSRLRATDTSRAPEAHTGLAWTHSRGQMRGFAAPDPREGVHAGKMEFKDLQMILFRFFSAGDRSSIGVLGRRGRKGQESASRLCSRLQSPLLPAALGPCSSASARAQPAWGSCWHSAGQRRQHWVGSSKGAAPPPTPGLVGPGGAWRAAWCRQASGGWPAWAPRRPAASDRIARGGWAGSRAPTRVKGRPKLPS